MFLVDPKVFRFVVKGVKAIFLGVQRGWGSKSPKTIAESSTMSRNKPRSNHC